MTIIKTYNCNILVSAKKFDRFLYTVYFVFEWYLLNKQITIKINIQFNKMEIKIGV